MTIQSSITPPQRDIGDFLVRRALPSSQQRAVGPFVFFDEMGPARFAPGDGLDVRPHPHIGLATVTYLFRGAILHRDSLDTVQPIEPGHVNWMVAGRGIVHSERSPAELRAAGHELHGMQAWIALPEADETTEPAFVHYPAGDLPELDVDGARLRLIAGSAYGYRSPVAVFSSMMYLEVDMRAGARLELPGEHPERAVYVVSGRLQVGDEPVASGTLAVLTPRSAAAIHATEPTRAMILGGEPVGRRKLWWNLVASQPEAIELAKRDWQASIDAGFRGSRFTLPPDEDEHIPLPESATGPPEPSKDCPTT